RGRPSRPSPPPAASRALAVDTARRRRCQPAMSEVRSSREILPWIAPHRTPDCCGSLADPPSEVQFTITTTAHPRRVRGTIAARRAPAIVGILVLALAVTGAGVVVAVGPPHGRSKAARVAATRTVVPRPVEQAYRYPFGCLSVMIAAAERGRALAGL